jgi:hypothetical protein
MSLEEDSQLHVVCCECGEVVKHFQTKLMNDNS